MGNLRKYMPITFLTMLLGWLAICGIPIWAGFFSKDEILYKTFSTHTSAYDATLLGIHVNTILWVVGLLTAVLTAVYMTRLMVMTFFGNERFHQPIEDLPVAEDLDEASRAEENAFAMGDAHDAVEPHGDAHALAHAHEDEHDDDEDEEHHHHLPHDFKPHESPWVMTGPLIVLAVLSTLGGLVGIPYAMSSLFGAGDVNVFEHTLAPVIQKVGHKEIADKPTLKVEDSHATSSSAPKTESHSTDAEHVAHSPEEIRTERLLAGLSVLLAVGGIAIGWFVFMGNPLKKMPRILEQKMAHRRALQRLCRRSVDERFAQRFVAGLRSRRYRRHRQRRRADGRRAGFGRARHSGRIRPQLRRVYPVRRADRHRVFYLLRIKVDRLKRSAGILPALRLIRNQY